MGHRHRSAGQDAMGDEPHPPNRPAAGRHTAAWRYLPLAVGGAACVGAVSLRAGLPGRADDRRPVDLASPPAAKVIHYVSPRQLAAAAVPPAVSAVEATAHNGDQFRWPDPADSRPLLLVFLKDGCPCNADFEPLFYRLHAAYGAAIRFAAVLDADPDAAARYAAEHRTPYPVLADPARRIAKAVRAEGGGYIALCVHTGVDRVWPGVSTEVVHGVGSRLASVAGVPERPVDTAGAPDALLTGCPYTR